MITLAIMTDDEHRATVAVAVRLVRRQDRRVSSFRRNVTDALAKAAVAEFISTTKKFDREVGVIGSECGLHGAEMLITQG